MQAANAKLYEQIVASAERRLPIGVSAMVIDGVLKVSHVVGLSDSPDSGVSQT